MQAFQLSSILSAMAKVILNETFLQQLTGMNLSTGRIECFMIKLNSNADAHQNKKINNKLLHKVQFFIHFCICYMESWCFHNTAEEFLSPFFKQNLGAAFGMEQDFCLKRKLL